MQTVLPKHEVVLLGVGHTNAHVLRMWRMQPIPRARLTCVSNFPTATYSGMLPAVLAGQILPERMDIDLVRLTAAVGARLIVGNVNGIDLDSRLLLFDDRPALPFDVLSVGIGSVPSPPPEGFEADRLLKVKPMQTFLQRLENRLRRLQEEVPDRPLRISVVGGGIAGVEVTFCLRQRLQQLVGDRYQLTLVQGADHLVPNALANTRHAIQRELKAFQVKIRCGSYVDRIGTEELVFKNGEVMPTDLVLWATGATSPPLLERLTDLPRDGAGFLRTRQTLRVADDTPIFAVGDTGTIEGMRLPKAGVYAVRQGPVLWENIKRMLRGDRLESYYPQPNFLKLLNLGDGRAIGEYKGFTFCNRLAGWLKASIDGRFMDKFQDYEPMSPEAPLANTETTMRCAGCGSKVGGSVLSRVLERLEVPRDDRIIMGLDAPDDAAVIKTVESKPMTATVDFFSAPLDDPYLVGRIAVLNAASDLFAMGTRPTAALAIATIPVGRPDRQEALLYELLAGSVEELKKMGATLVGGHTTEGPQTLLGFTMLANETRLPVATKQQLQVGDVLVTTKPLGTGVLLAAHMRAACQAAWMQPLLDSMLQSNQDAAVAAMQLPVRATTDVTGFGLAGHLGEMLRASQMSCELWLDRLPHLPGALSLISDGIESTLAPANRESEAFIDVKQSLRTAPLYQLLFDPQTSGGLLFSVREDDLTTLLASLPKDSAVIGRVCEKDQDRLPTIHVSASAPVAVE